VTEEEIKRAKDYGKNAVDGKVSVEESGKWMKDLRTGF